MTSELFTVAEAADFLRTTPAAVYHMVERAQLPGIVRMGRRVLFRADDLRRHVGIASTASRATETPSSDSIAERRESCLSH